MAYGSHNVLTLTRKVIEELGPAWTQALPEKIAVLHGHFTFPEIHDLHQRSNSRLIAWLRHPVERVIFNYAFFIRKVHSGVRPEEHHRQNESLLDYASLDETRNRMSTFLEGITLKGLFFVGIMEYFENDLNDLARTLSWERIEPIHLNCNRTYKRRLPPVDKATRQVIFELNLRDAVLYTEALKLRQRRRNSSYSWTDHG